jgi:RND family efflux transporter MFP subunit
MRRSTALLAVGLALSIGCSRGSQGSASAGAGGFPPTPVELSAATLMPVEDASEYVATLKSLRSTSVQPQTDGQITEILVKSGDRVQQGAPLFEIDPRRQQAAVTSQQAELASRKAAVAYAQQQQQRTSELFKAGAISKQESEQADTALQTAQADLQALQAQLQQQEVQLRYFTVAAPTSGTIGDVPVRVGNQVTTQTVLTTIDRNETLELNVSIPVERSRDLSMGTPIRILSSDGQQVLGSTRVSFISARVDDQTQSILVKANVSNGTLALRASQFVRARVIWKTTSQLVVPVTAVLRINGQFFAFVGEEAGGKLVAHQRAIKVGPITGNDYPVMEGIKAGERIVVSGAQKLADGGPIVAASQTQKSAAPRN